MSLTSLCQELRNWFCKDEDKHSGTFEIVNGVIALPFLQKGQYFRIKGSVFNDGVFQYIGSGNASLPDLVDETFDGEIWSMRIPKEVIALSAKIEEWVEANTKALSSPYQSESWNGYSYSLKGGGLNGGTVTWQSQFANELNRWRKV